MSYKIWNELDILTAPSKLAVVEEAAARPRSQQQRKLELTLLLTEAEAEAVDPHKTATTLERVGLALEG